MKQQLVLGRGERDVASASARCPRRRVELEVADTQDLGHGFAPTEHGAQTRGEDAETERLDQVVVRAAVETDDLVHRTVLGGEKDDAQVGPFRACLTAHREPVQTRHDDVEHEQVRAPVAHGLQRQIAVRRRHNDVAFPPQRAFDDAGDSLVVIRDEDARGGAVADRHRPDCQGISDGGKGPVGPDL